MVRKYESLNNNTNKSPKKPSETKVVWDEELIHENPSVAPKKLPQRVYKRGTQGTLVYSPDIAIYIYTADHGILDLGPYMTSFSINRTVNNISTFSCTFDNKYSRYDRVIRRMDRVAVFLKRIEWVQVFAGYITVAPWETVVPGDSQIEAECTLKRLKHTFWDPNAPASWSLFPPLVANGAWRADGSDGGAALSMYTILTTIAHWDPSQIKIQAIPEVWIQKAADLLNKVNEKEYNDTESGAELRVVQESLKKIMSANGWIDDGTTAPADDMAAAGSTPADGDGNINSGTNKPTNVDTNSTPDGEVQFQSSHKLGNLPTGIVINTGFKIAESAPTSLRGEDVILRADAAAALQQVVAQAKTSGDKIASSIAVAYLPKTALTNLTNGTPPRKLPSAQIRNV